MVASSESKLAVAPKMIHAIRMGTGPVPSPTDFHVMPVTKPLVMCLVTEALFYRILRMRKATPWFVTHSEVECCDIRNVAIAAIFTGLKIGKGRTIR